ncbi:UNKNOWN [Stylonychia lemnae]|uniref:Uncharacterized protein n=1 Tax=Stylonychia lemnae TaxID=5949 RepID=A0A078ASM5_STYLE|nr:UNKNOWN [Stylonychia lemnae]|eukprot:CDW84991.1 UNKNOWN [Stylonychia lemnae]
MESTSQNQATENSATTNQATEKSLYIQGVESLREAASILVCNWTDLNYAIEQGLNNKNRKLNLEDEKEIEALKELVNYLKSERKSDMALRNELIQNMVDLCLAQDVELEDFEDCILDFMEINFSMMIEDNSAKEIGAAMMKIRRELFTSAQNKQVLESDELQKLREFNEQKNLAKKRKQEKEAQERLEVGEDDMDEEEETEQKEEKPKQTGPVFDDDGFEVVTTEKKGRRR